MSGWKKIFRKFLSFFYILRILLGSCLQLPDLKSTSPLPTLLIPGLHIPWPNEMVLKISLVLLTLTPWPSLRPFSTWSDSSIGQGWLDLGAVSSLSFCGASWFSFSLAAPCGKWDLSSLTRDWTHALCIQGSLSATGSWLSFPFCDLISVFLWIFFHCYMESHFTDTQLFTEISSAFLKFSPWRSCLYVFPQICS